METLRVNAEALAQDLIQAQKSFATVKSEQELLELKGLLRRQQEIEVRMRGSWRALNLTSLKGGLQCTFNLQLDFSGIMLTCSFLLCQPGFQLISKYMLGLGWDWLPLHNIGVDVHIQSHWSCPSNITLYSENSFLAFLGLSEWEFLTVCGQQINMHP